MILPRSVLRDQRGSALLISLVMIVVITMLGLALFQLGQIEGQQAGASLGDARAFEMAQAGMERAIRELSNAFLLDPYGSESWVDGPNRPTCTPACETAVYHPMTLANNTLSPAGANPLTGQDPGGTFTVELKQVTVAEANNPISQGAGYTYPYGQSCIPSAPTNPTICANLMFVRSTGTVAGPPGYTATRTVQALAKAYSTSFFAGGLTADRATFGGDPAIDGRVLIAGSVHILGSGSTSNAFQIDGGATQGMRNSFADLWPDTDAAGVRALARLAPTDSVAEPSAARRRQLICPTGADCTGGTNLVESLDAQLKVFGNPSNTMVVLKNNTDLGINAIQTASPYGDVTIGSRYGKGLIDGVYVSDGCQMPCTSQAFTFNGTSTIYVDTNNYTKPYPYQPTKLPLSNQSGFVPNVYPTAADGTFINGTTYATWWADYLVFHTKTNPGLSGGPAVAPPGVNLNATGNYARISSDRANGGYCGNSGPNDFTTTSSLGNIVSAGLDDGNGDGSQGFCHTFKFTDKAGVIRVGEICWRRFNASGRTSLNLLNPPPNSNTFKTLEFGSPSCDVPTNPSDPLIIEFITRFRFQSSGAEATYQYRGSALIYLGTNDLHVEQGLQTACSASPCTGQRFPEDNLLMFVLRGSGNVEIANTGNAVNDVVHRFMAYVYAERSVQVQKATNLIGSLRAQQFCFNNSSSTNGCGGVGPQFGNPKFFQANFIDLRKIPAELPASSGDSGNRWLVDVVPRFWIECRRGPGDILPTTPTGTCQYQ